MKFSADMFTPYGLPALECYLGIRSLFLTILLYHLLLGIRIHHLFVDSSRINF